jgi:nucleoside-diphosphate-sugar epimerase
MMPRATQRDPGRRPVIMTHYLVTGGAGFIGSHIAEALARDGHAVRVFDNLSSGKASNLAGCQADVELERGDVRDLEALRASMAGVEVVFHEAALASVAASVADPVGSLAVNLVGTQNVLVAARDAGVRRVVFASSAAVYGDLPELPKREEMVPHPISPYAVHKLAGEHLCQVFTRLYGLETVALRYFNVFGPRQDPSSEYSGAISRFLTTLLEGRQPTVFGDGEQTRDFVYVSDVVQANLLAASEQGVVGQAINIGTGERTSLNQLLRVSGELAGASVTPTYAAPRAGDIRDSVADISRARDALGYAPSVELREGLRRTLDAMRAREI